MMGLIQDRVYGVAAAGDSKEAGEVHIFLRDVGRRKNGSIQEESMAGFDR
jgi:hypothetical protein